MIISTSCIPEDEVKTLSCEVKDYDPLQAFTPGSDRLDAYRQLALHVRVLLKPKGLVALEIG